MANIRLEQKVLAGMSPEQRDSLARDKRMARDTSPMNFGEVLIVSISEYLNSFNKKEYGLSFETKDGQRYTFLGNQTLHLSLL